MEIPDTKTASGLASLARTNWTAVIGLVGLFMLVTTLLTNIPTDRVVALDVALILFGWGFGQTECRTFLLVETTLGPMFKPHWRMTLTGFVLLTIAAFTAGHLARYLELGTTLHQMRPAWLGG